MLAGGGTGKLQHSRAIIVHYATIIYNLSVLFTLQELVYRQPIAFKEFNISDKPEFYFCESNGAQNRPWFCPPQLTSLLYLTSYIVRGQAAILINICTNYKIH